jgi:hypothetical protein
MPDAKKAVREARQRAGTCFACVEIGHRARQCPRQALTKIEIQAIKRDDFDGDAAQVTMYATHYVLIATDYAIFAPKELIFDPAAFMSVLTNPSLLTDVSLSNSPALIEGFQQGAPGVRIDDVENFRDLGDVGIGKEAACNILFACQI